VNMLVVAADVLVYVGDLDGVFGAVTEMFEMSSFSSVPSSRSSSLQSCRSANNRHVTCDPTDIHRRHFVFTVELLPIMKHDRATHRTNKTNADADADVDDRQEVTPNDWRLQRSGRYAHSEGYLRRLASKYAMTVERMTPIVPRKENGREIHGLLCVLYM
jgi:hypothetical protein